MEREPLGGLLSYPGQFGKLVHEIVEYAFF
jgi:hypothetical protein